MSLNLEQQLAVEVFIPRVQQLSQGAGILDGCFTEEGTIIGNEVHFPVMGRSRMVPKVHRGKVVPANVGYARPKATMRDYHLAELTDAFEDIKTNVSEREALARNFAMAGGRQKDQFGIYGLAETPTILGQTRETVSIGANPNTAFDITAKDLTRPSRAIGQAKARLLDNEVMENQPFYFLGPAPWYESFAADESFASTRYVDGKVTESGRMPAGHGVMLKFMGSRVDAATDIDDAAKGGWDSAGGIGYMWAQSAVGRMVGMTSTIRVDWLPDYTSHVTVMTLSMGAKQIDPYGVIAIINGPTGFVT